MGRSFQNDNRFASTQQHHFHRCLFWFGVSSTYLLNAQIVAQPAKARDIFICSPPRACLRIAAAVFNPGAWRRC